MPIKTPRWLCHWYCGGLWNDECECEEHEKNCGLNPAVGYCMTCAKRNEVCRNLRNYSMRCEDHVPRENDVDAPGERGE